MYRCYYVVNLVTVLIEKTGEEPFENKDLFERLNRLR